MTFLFEVTIAHIAYVCIGGFVVFFGMFSLFLREKLYVGEACWAFLFGVIIGPYGANIFNPHDWGDEKTVNSITLEITRVVLAIGVFAIGVELPKQYMKHHWKSLFFLLGPGMTWGWFVSAGLIYALIPKLNFLSSLTVAACLTPTDPILAAAVVGGKYADKHVPAHLRHLLAAESGCNDGAAFPFLFIGLYLTLDKTTGGAVRDWFLLLWLYQIVLGTVIGTLVGIAFRHLMKFCERKELIDRQSYVAQYISLALLTIGACTMLGSDDLLATFACGTAFAWDGFFNRQTDEAVFSSVIDLLFNIACFVYIGAWMPFRDFHAPELSLSPWRLIVIGLLVLVLRRLPVVLALYKWIPDIKTFREAVFSGHFGPIGVGAVFISTLAAERLPHPHSPPEGQAELLAATIQPIVAFMVLCSILVHGLSIPFFSLGRRVHSVRREWSRRSTLEPGAQPEWANQTRQLRPGEEIEVNRDDLAERGEIAPGATAEKQRESPRADTTSSEELTAAEKQHVHDRTAEKPDGSPTSSQAEENPPDGDNIVAEWKEGHHRVIERRSGPGEEVEVEVQKNAFADDKPQITSTFRGEDSVMRHTTRAYLDRVKQHAEEMERELQDVASGRGKHRTPRDAERHRDADDADDAESESGLPESGPSSYASTPRGGSPERGADVRQPSLPLRGGRGGKRRRQSMRRQIYEASADDERGRHTSSQRPPFQQRSPLRSLSPSGRSASPARSVRWADDRAPDDRTPQSPLSRTDGDSPQDDADRHVVFQLPTRKAAEP